MSNVQVALLFTMSFVKRYLIVRVIIFPHKVASRPSYSIKGSTANHGSGNANINNSENSKKEEFRRYLEKSGVMDALTKVLVGLYEEPDRVNINALDYLKKYLGAPSGVDLDGMKRENEAMKRQIEKYKKQLAIQEKDHPPGDNTIIPKLDK